jgi:transcriptional regulator with XRE-family HTH domain
MVTRWEKGQTVPRDETLERIASALEVSVEELIATERKGPLRLPGLAEDQELVQLLSQLHSLEGRDIDALKVFLDAMLTKARIREMVVSSVAVAQAS